MEQSMEHSTEQSTEVCRQAHGHAHVSECCGRKASKECWHGRWTCLVRTPEWPEGSDARTLASPRTRAHARRRTCTAPAAGGITMLDHCTDVVAAD